MIAMNNFGQGRPQAATSRSGANKKQVADERRHLFARFTSMGAGPDELESRGAGAGFEQAALSISHASGAGADGRGGGPDRAG